MGEAKRKQISDAAFRDMHPHCAYCGAKTETVEHFPPRAFFHNRIWPDGFRFPACFGCNNNTRKDELVVSCLARVGLNDGPSNDKTVQLLEAIRNNYPEVMREWFDSVSRNRLRSALRKGFGEKHGDELRRQGWGGFYYGELTHECFRKFGEKLVRALYYKHTGRRVDGRVFCKVQSFIEQREQIEAALQLAPLFQLTERNRKSLSDQFAYRYSIDKARGAFFLVAQLGTQLGYIGHAFSAEYLPGMNVEGRGLALFEEYYGLLP